MNQALALPNLDDIAWERLAVDRFLTKITDPQLAFGVLQRQPTTINDDAATTLEMQSHLSLANTASRPSISTTTQPNCLLPLRTRGPLSKRLLHLYTIPTVPGKLQPLGAVDRTYEGFPNMYHQAHRPQHPSRAHSY